MRDCLKNRAGFDRVLMAVAATFLTVSATSAMAQADPARNSAAELAIDAAIPRPEPANVPPPTINDFKLDTTASAPDAAETRRADDKPPMTPQHRADAAKAAPAKPTPNKADTARATPQDRPPSATPPAATAATTAGRRRLPQRLRPAATPAERTGQGRQQCAAGGSAGRRQAARDAGRQIAALFRPQGRTDGGREILHRARIRAALDARRRR